MRRKAHALSQIVRIMTSSMTWRGDENTAEQMAVVKIQTIVTPQGVAIIPSAAFRPVSIMSPSAGHSSFLILHYIMVMMESDQRCSAVLKHGSRYLGHCCCDVTHRKKVDAQVKEFLSYLHLLDFHQDHVDNFLNPLKAIIALGSVSGGCHGSSCRHHHHSFNFHVAPPHK